MARALPGDAAPHRRMGPVPKSRVLGFALSVVLLVSACGPKTEIIYVDPKEHGAYTPLGRSADPRVHQDGAHELQEKVEIGPDPGDGHAAPYTTFSSSHDPRIHPGGQYKIAPKVTLAHERGGSDLDSHASASDSSHDDDHAPSTAAKPAPTPIPSAVGKPSVAKPAAASAPAVAHPANVASALAAAKPVASPALPATLNLGAGPGAVPGTSSGSGAAVLDDDDEDVLDTIAGRIENVAGRSLLIQTASGKARMRVADNARVDRDALGSAADLKPGMFVGVLHAPAGPATSVRIYAIGPSMPRPGVVPMAGSRVGQITTFGKIISLQFGGLLLNTGGETTTVTLPGTVEILKPVASASPELAAGTHIIATGPVNGDGTLVATGVRVTASPQPER